MLLPHHCVLGSLYSSLAGHTRQDMHIWGAECHVRVAQTTVVRYGTEKTPRCFWPRQQSRPWLRWHPFVHAPQTFLPSFVDGAAIAFWGPARAYANGALQWARYGKGVQWVGPAGHLVAWQQCRSHGNSAGRMKQRCKVREMHCGATLLGSFHTGEKGAGTRGGAKSQPQTRPAHMVQRMRHPTHTQ